MNLFEYYIIKTLDKVIEKNIKSPDESFYCICPFLYMEGGSSHFAFSCCYKGNMRKCEMADHAYGFHTFLLKIRKIRNYLSLN